MENKNDIVAEVYQVIRNRHDVAFMDLDFIKKHNLFDFKNYDKTATIELDDTEANTDAILEEIFMYGNVNELFFENNPEARSISVSDIIKLNDKYYYCNPTGFEDVTEMVSDVKTEQKQLTEADTETKTAKFSIRLDVDEDLGLDVDIKDLIKFQDDKNIVDLKDVNTSNKSGDVIISGTLEYKDIPASELEDKLTNLINKDVLKENNVKVLSVDIENEEKEPAEGKTLLDLLQDRIGQPLSVGELNTTLQSLFGQYNKVFLLRGDLYSKDLDETQELEVDDDEDIYIIKYDIVDMDNGIIEITDVDLEY